MKLAKDCLDVGLQTNSRDPMLRFWGETIGLPYEELLKLGGGTHQHRHTLNTSVFKLNHARDPLPDSGPTGYTELLIAREEVSAPQPKTDPDGNLVTLVPAGHDDISQIGMVMNVRSLANSMAFYRDVLQGKPLSENRVRIGTTVIRLQERQDHHPCESMRGVGYRYLTVQIWDVDAEHRGILERGGREGRAPVTLGQTARISFVLDPDNNWIEISQRASLTGTLESSVS